MADEIQTLLRGWIDSITQRKGWTRTRLAREAGIAATTITRLFDDTYAGTLNAASIAKIARASGMPAPRNFGGVSEAAPGMAEPDAVPLTAEFAGGRDLTANQSVWTVQGQGLAAMGLMPGDRFILDQSVQPQTRDIIMVQSYDNASGTAETLLRVYADGFAVTPLYLVDGQRRMWIDGSNVAVMGVVVESWRGRTSA